MANNDTVSIGNAGEYFVAGELERHGFTVAIPMSNVKDFDILAINRTTYQQYAIQVKTTGYKSKKWLLSKKNEDIVADNVIYFFVALNELETPEYHIVPAKIVADTLKREYEKWISTPGKNGQKHKDNSMRCFYDKEDVYLNRWDYLTGEVSADKHCCNRKTISEKIDILKSHMGQNLSESAYYKMMEDLGDLKNNYMSYMKSAPINCDYELRRLDDADYDLAAALLTMMLREDHFNNGSFEKRLRLGQVDNVLQRMVLLLEKVI